MIKLATVQMLDALELLDALVRCDRLREAEQAAFRDMAAKIRRGDKQNLSREQREWAERRYTDLELDADAPAVNAVSSGLVPGDPGGAPAVLKRVLERVPEKFQKPLRPPGMG
jgi:hypothetical protein